MRRFAPLLIAVIAVILAALGVAYFENKQRQARDLPKKPDPLATSLNASASGWQWSYSTAGKPIIEVHAKELKHVKEPSVFDLATVELKIFHQDGKKFDRVLSPKAQFSLNDGKLYSDAEVTITMGLMSDDTPPGRLLGIKSSGVVFEKTGKAETDRHATFSLDLGQGESDGASYDPQTRELHLRRNARLIWRGHNPKSPPMHIEAGEMIYKELEQKVYLMPWSKFSRNTLAMTGGPAIITLEEGNIRLVSAEKASGTDTQPTKKVEFGADQLDMIFRDKGVIEKITGQTNARLTSSSASAATIIKANRLDLSFVEADQSAVLQQAFASGGSIAESIPVRREGVKTPETKILRSEVIDIRMKEGGEELDQLDTHAAGTLEFLPNTAGQRKRRLEGSRISIKYGANNQLESFRSSNVATFTEPDPQVKGSAQQRTWSDDLKAEFDPKTGEMSRLEQWGNFRYEEGERKARSQRALLEESKNVITLTRDARMWDPTGSTDAESITIDEKNSITTAIGKVATVREPEQEGEDKIRGTGDRMVTAANNTKIHYEGNAKLWQGESRLEGKQIDIDRTTQELRASGGIVNTLRGKKDAATTVIRSETMRYLDREKVSYYDGGVLLTRPDLTVKARKLRGYLSDEESEETASTIPDSSLDRAFAEGEVEIVQRDEFRNRVGTGDVADYYVADNRVILEGPMAQLTETKPGLKPTLTKGRKLTWFGNTDKLLVDGAGAQPAVSTLRRKK